MSSKPHVSIRCSKFQGRSLNPSQLWFSIQWKGSQPVELRTHLGESQVTVTQFWPGAVISGMQTATGWISATTKAAQIAAHDALLHFIVVTQSTEAVVEFMNVTVGARYSATQPSPDEV